MALGGEAPGGRRYEFDAGVASRLLRQTGGFSMQRTTGRSPTTGYMVSDFGSEHVVPGFASPREIEDYRQSNPNPTSTKRYVGGWHDEGKTYLDQSARVMTHRTAQATGRLNAQKAVYNVGRGTARRVHFGGAMDVRGSLFEGHPGLRTELRVGNSDALRQQQELHLRLVNAAHNAGRASSHRLEAQGYQPKLPGMRRI